ncbi:MAG TPA: hypothetical protein VE289_01410 [Gaiellaceae bacterium]|nr:hypothetical protein [Gaiellaceae bacterium]
MLVADPLPVLFVIGALLALALFALGRTTWRPTAPLRAMRRRAWGQTLAAPWRMYVARWRLFMGIGLAFVPVVVLIAALQALVFGGAGFVGVEREGESGGVLALLVGVIGTTLALTGLGLVQGATARALVEIDNRRPIDPIRAYRLAFVRFRPMLAAVAAAVALVALLGATLALVPVAVWLVGRWALIAQAVELEGVSPLRVLRRSSELVRGRWLKVVSLVVAGAAVALAVGPLVGALLILLTDAPFALLNVVAGLVYVIAMPLVALTTAYVYFDAVVRERVEPPPGLDELPAEVQ